MPTIEMMSSFGTAKHERFARQEWPAVAALLERLVYATGFAGEPGWRCKAVDHRQYAGTGPGRDSVQVREETPAQRKVTLRVRAAVNAMYFDVQLLFGLPSQSPHDVIRAIRQAADKLSGRVAVYADGPPPPPPPPPATIAERMQKATERMQKAMLAYKNLAAVEDLKASAEAHLAAVAERIRGPKADRQEVAARVEELRDATADLARRRDDLAAALEGVTKALADQSAQLDVARTELEAADVTYRPLLAEYGAAEQALREVEANERELRAALDRAGDLGDVLTALEKMP